jgi:hypothetical protein
MKSLPLDLEFSQYWKKLSDWEKHSLLRIAKIYLRVRQMKRPLMKASLDHDERELIGPITD